MTEREPNKVRVLELVRRNGVLRPRDLDAEGIPRATLSRMSSEGLLERVGRGLYREPAAEVSEHHALALAGKRVPRGVVCLLSALQFHDLTTQAPFEVWMALEGKARAPRFDYPPLRIVRFSEESLAHGVDVHTIEKVSVRVTTAPKTVADCFKFRNKIGLDVALEALRDYRRGRRSIEALWAAARVCRVRAVLRPYLEATV